jgi:SAM-dependent methyltransferase
MSEFWNERYASTEYAYGIEPNIFYRDNLKSIPPRKILFPAEGEGRNAVYAAKLGWDVTAFDVSTEGKKKAEMLAESVNVNIGYIISDFDNVSFPLNHFDCIVLVFAHMNPVKRQEYHRKLISFLKPGGILILEGFSKKQINNSSGGPRDINMLFSADELQSDFGLLSEIKISETDYILNEGPFHQGIASVIRANGIK